MVKTLHYRVLYIIELNTTWTDEIGAKTKKIWRKQDWKDLVAINYRFKGSWEDLQDTLNSAREKDKGQG
jgi:hypothetical protein